MDDFKCYWTINRYGSLTFTDHIMMIHASLKICIIVYQIIQYSIIMVGDYNTVLNTSIDRVGNHSTNYHPHALKEIINVMQLQF